MSLQIWIPMNGNLNNQGLSGDMSVVGSGITYETGKVTKDSCKFDPTQSSYIKINGYDVNTDVSDMTYACWLCKDKNGSMMPFNVSNTTNVSPNIFFNVNIHLNTGDGLSNPFSNNGVRVPIPSLNEWHHYVVVFKKNTNAVLYIDGGYAGTAVSYKTIIGNTIQLSGWAYNDNNNYYWGGKMNDFRIYDHALSPREIKEISKGLMLHYTMSDPYIGNVKNLCTTPLSSMGYGNYAGKTTSSMMVDTSPIGTTDIVRFKTNTIERTDTSWHVYTKYYNILPSKKYTFSFYYRTNSITLYEFERRINGDGTSVWWNNGGSFTNPLEKMPIINDEKWHRVVFTLESPSTAKNLKMFIGCDKPDFYGDSNQYIDITGIQIEEGDHASPYVFGEMNNNIVYDSSGYCNNGSIDPIKCPSLLSDSPKYGGCYGFNGIDQLISYELPFYVGQTVDEISVSFWVYYVGGRYSTVIFGFTKGIWISLNCEGAGILVYLTRDGGAESDKYFRSNINNVSLNTWHHIVFTLKDGNHKLYLDGTLAGDEYKPNAKTIKIYSNKQYVGNIENEWKGIFNGRMSDLRWYATALSEEDIKELYSTRQSICKNGTLLVSGELIEE